MKYFSLKSECVPFPAEHALIHNEWEALNVALISLVLESLRLILDEADCDLKCSDSKR